MMKQFMTIKEILQSKSNISDELWTEYYEPADNKWYANNDFDMWDACIILPGNSGYDHCLMLSKNEEWSFFRRKHHD